MVPAGIFGNFLQVAGPGQLLKHHDRHVDVTIDNLALFGTQGAGPDGEVGDFVVRDERMCDFFAVLPSVVGCDIAHPLHRGIVHEFSTDIGVLEEGQVIAQAIKRRSRGVR